MNARAAIGRERRRQIQIRTAFESALALRESVERDLTDFYLACSAYIVFSMDRLHYQDQMIHDLLNQRILSDDKETHERLDRLSERQGKSRTIVEKFQRAAEALAQDGPDGRRHFEDAANLFVDTFLTLMAPRKNPFQQHTDELFTDQDWEKIAAVTDESLSIEEDLFKAVQATAPSDIDPETITVVYH